MNHLARDVLNLIATHPGLAALVIGATAFAESFAFISFFVPGFTILVAAGALVKAGVLDPVSAATAGIVGAVLGDAISFWIGQRFGNVLPRVWPFRKHPAALERGVRFFEKWGWPSVFIGRFSGPLRAFVPLAAGMCRMPLVPFYVANVLSAVIWAPALLFSGYVLGGALMSGLTLHQKVLVLGISALAVLALAYWLRRRLAAK